MYALVAAPPSRATLVESRWFKISLSAFELTLGVWLASGRLPGLARGVAVASFTAFAAVSAIKTLADAPSCDCLGRIALPPVYALILDVFALATLAAWQEKSGGIRVNWRSWLTGVSVGGLMVLVAGVAAAVAFRPDPGLYYQVTIAPPRHYFGRVPQNQSLTYAFKLTNSWDQPVELYDVHSTCGCSTADGVAGTVVDPGQSCDIPVRMKTEGTDGRKGAEVTVYYRTLDRHRTALRSVAVNALVETDYRVEPRGIDFGVVDNFTPVRTTVRLRPNKMADARVVGLELNHPAYAARLLDPRPVEGVQRIEVTFSARPLSHSGSVSAVMVVRTNSPIAPMSNVFLQATFAAPIATEPAAVVVGSDVPGPVERLVVVSARQPVRIIGVRCDDPRVAVGPYEKRAYLAHSLRLSLPDANDGRALNAALTIDVVKTDAAEESEACRLTVPIHRLLRTERVVAP